MDQRKSLIITGLALFFIIAVIVGTIAFLVRGIKNRQTASTVFPKPTVQASVPMFEGPSNIIDQPIINPSPSPSSSSRPAQQASPTPAPTPRGNQGGTTTVNGNLETYNASNFSISFSKSWGLLTCNNSSNFELDPTNSTDQLNYSCNYAVEPVTVLVGNVSCQGETVKLGNITVIKSVVNTSTGKNYRWCTQTQPMLDITHRVSSGGGRATSTQDYSSQIEEMIKTFKPGAGL